MKFTYLLFAVSLFLPFVFYKCVPYNGSSYEVKVMEVERQQADQRLLDFIVGYTNIVDEQDLSIGSPEMVERAYDKLD